MEIPLAIIILLCMSSEAFELPYLRTPPTVTPDYLAPRNLIISWRSWESDGGGDGPITGYEVLYRYARNGSGDSSYDYSRTVDSNVTTSVVIGGLDVETDYDFAIVVVGEGGAGSPSNKTTYKTLCAAPSAPLTLSVSRIETDELEITWELPPPSTWGCSELGSQVFLQWKQSLSTSFTLVYMDRALGSYNLSLLTPCIMYDLKAQFSSPSFLLSPESEVISATTAKTEPPPVSYVNTRYAEDSMELEVTWPYPVNYNRMCIEEFHVTLTPLRLVACETDIVSPVTQIQVVLANSTGVVFGAVLPYTEYNATVTSSNELGKSEVTFKTGVTSETLPSVMQAVQVAEVSPRSVRLAWTRIPCEDVHGAFYQYSFLFTNNQTGETFSRQSGDIDVTELSERTVLPCMSYNVQIRAVSGAGNGPWSEKQRFRTTPEVSQSVRNSDASAVDDNPNALLVTWDVPYEVYCPIDYYEVSYKLLYKFQCEDGNMERIGAANTTETAYTITGLLPYSTYDVYVRAHSEAGFGYDGRAGILQTAQKVPTDTPIEVTVASYTNDWLHFSFRRRDCSESSWSSRLIAYVYQLDNLDNTSQPLTGNSTANYLRFEGLIPYTRYSFRVKMRTEAGDGPYSDPVEGRTNEDEPGPPASLTILNKTESTVDIAWDAPTAPNGIILNYTVQYKAIEKPYDPYFAPSSIYFVEAALVGPAVFTYKLESLEPGTKYSIRVAALTAPGAGEYIYREAFTELKTDIQEPEKPAFDPSRSSGTSVFIYIYSSDPTYVTSYLIAVKKTSARQKRTSVVIDGESYGTYNENPDAYIAAEVPKEGVNSVGFVVGDGKMYGGYLNAPLGEGTYSVRVGAASKAEDASSVSWSEPLVRNATGVPTTSPSPTQKPDPRPPTNPGPPKDGSDSVGIIAGVIIAVLVVLIIIGLVVYYMRLRRKREVEDGTAGTPMEETSKKDSVKV
ncbi:phosphatidylinositol phosphatase PTPRQ-like [Patiria miniata]|uniref:Fibronectin type-III domain-containing protein n=1 Tax=Patiria miniata TaxID=46514 RepID=A0A914AK92_PATMI|nr:phosphatidylinositol phosphatase PTPRQ-like [Patiria miniata]